MWIDKVCCVRGKVWEENRDGISYPHVIHTQCIVLFSSKRYYKTIIDTWGKASRYLYRLNHLLYMHVSVCSTSSSEKPKLSERISDAVKSYIYTPEDGIYCITVSFHTVLNCLQYLSDSVSAQLVMCFFPLLFYASIPFPNEAGNISCGVIHCYLPGKYLSV